jgi:hypothetical protein
VITTLSAGKLDEVAHSIAPPAVAGPPKVRPQCVPRIEISRIAPQSEVRPSAGITCVYTLFLP